MSGVSLRGDLGNKGAEGLSFAQPGSSHCLREACDCCPDDPGRPVHLSPHPWALGFWWPWSQASLSTGRAPSRPGSCCQGPRAQGGFGPHSVGLAVSDRRRFGAYTGSEGLRPSALRSPEVMWLAWQPGLVEAGLSHLPDGVVGWREVRGQAQRRVASRQRAGCACGAASSRSGLWVPASRGWALTCGPFSLADSKGLSNPAEVEALREKVYASLEAYCKQKYPEQPGR